MAALIPLAAPVGCSTAGKKKKTEGTTTAAAVPTPTPRPPGSYEKLGVIVLVNKEAGFVLVDVGLYNPSIGETLKSFSPEVRPGNTGESAVLTVSVERARPFVIADIVEGEPAKGDLVYR